MHAQKYGGVLNNITHLTIRYINQKGLHSFYNNHGLTVPASDTDQPF